MLISVFTPHHGANQEFIQECWESLQSQSFADWEWVVLLNNGGELPEDAVRDPRVRVLRLPPSTYNVGFLKRYLCDQARGDVLFELDDDDRLLSGALLECAAAFTAGDPDFVYSEAVEVNKNWATTVYSPYWGWKTGEVEVDGRKLTYNRAFPPSAHMVRLIYWAPNHFRAWRASFYRQIGGHDANFSICDDHDILCRTYQKGKMQLIAKPLYLQRVHERNTQKTRNAEIQQLTKQLYQRNLWPLVERWADERKLKKLDLGAALGAAREGFLTVDRRPGCGVQADLEKPWPFQDGEVGVIRAVDFIEHIHDPVFLMNEAWRCLAPGGWFLISVPSAEGRGAFQDPTHCSFWNENSFWYYTDEKFSRFIPEFRGQFQRTHLATSFPTPWHQEHQIPYVDAHLVAVKTGYEPIGEHLFKH